MSILKQLRTYFILLQVLPLIIGENSKQSTSSSQELQPTKYPWAVQIAIQNIHNKSRLFFCGGAVITENVVLSAAHCFFDKPKSLHTVEIVWPGCVRGLNFGVKVKHIMLHPKFNPNEMVHDIAFLLTTEPMIDAQRVLELPISEYVLPVPNANDTSIKEASVISYGNGSILERVSVRPELTEGCNEAFHQNNLRNITISQICAYQKDNKLSFGNSGSALICDYDKNRTFCGILSYGFGIEEHLQVYTYVPFYLTWINSVLLLLGLRKKGFNIKRKFSN